MSGASSSPGVRLCQWLHCHSCPGAPVSLSINYLFHSKHGLTLSKRLVHSLSIHRETRSSCSFLLRVSALCGKISDSAFVVKLRMNRPVCLRLSLCACACLSGCTLDGQNSDYTTGQVFDLSEKLEQSEAQLGRGSFMLGLDTHDRKSEDKLAKATRDRWVLSSKNAQTNPGCLFF